MVRPFMRGKVLEVGAGHRPRRGSFQPPLESCDDWLYLDINEWRQPDVQATILSLKIQFLIRSYVLKFSNMSQIRMLP